MSCWWYPKELGLPVITRIANYKDISLISPSLSRARDSWSRSHCLKPGIGDRVEYCVMFGNSCRSSSTTCFIRKFPRSTPLSPARNIEINSLLKLFSNYHQFVRNFPSTPWTPRTRWPKIDLAGYGMIRVKWRQESGWQDFQWLDEGQQYFGGKGVCSFFRRDTG